jgi:dephospho-CoA kinase
MKIIGITGNAGGGKSATVNYFRSKGIVCIIADDINAELLQQSRFIGHTIEKISRLRIINPDGSLNKTILRDLVFSSTTFREQLELLLHPIIMDNIALQLALLPEQPYFIVEIPLLFEAALTDRVDRIILVTADHKILLKRLCIRNSISRDTAESILDIQLEDSQKIPASDDIVLNNQGFDSLHNQLDLLHSQYI